MTPKSSDRCTCKHSRWRHSYQGGYCTTPNCKCLDFEMAEDQTPPPPSERNLEYDRRETPRITDEDRTIHAEQAREAAHARRFQ